MHVNFGLLYERVIECLDIKIK